MSSQQLRFENVSFYYPSLHEPVFQDLSLSMERGFTGVVGPNGTGKTTLLRLAAGELEPHQGTIQTPGRIVYCEQRTDTAPDDLETFLNTTNARACRLRGRLNLQTDWLSRWDTLSHGERKRAYCIILDVSVISPQTGNP
jgi:ATPase subunit of ABC transporter with duplicated ATPase domains